MLEYDSIFNRTLPNHQLYKLDYILRFFFIPIAVWPLVYSQYMSFTQLGLIFSVAFLWQTLLELPSGALADLIGRKKTMVMGLIFRFLGFLCVVVGNSIWWFLLAELLDKTYEGLYSGSGQALVYDSLLQEGKEDQFEQVENQAYFWATNFYIVASILGGFLFVIHPKAPYWALLIPSALVVLVSLLYKEPKLDTQKFSLKSYLKQNTEGFKHIFRQKEVTLMSFYSIAISFVFLTGLWWLYQKAADEVGLAPQYVGFLIGALYGFRSLGSFLIDKFRQTQKDRRLLWLAVMQASTSILVAVPSNAIGILGLAGRYVSDGFRQPLVTAAQNKHIDSKYRATALSAVALVTSLLLAVTNPIMGWGIDTFGARTVIGASSLISILLAAPLAIAIMRLEKSKNEY